MAGNCDFQDMPRRACKQIEGQQVHWLHSPFGEDIDRYRNSRGSHIVRRYLARIDISDRCELATLDAVATTTSRPTHCSSSQPLLDMRLLFLEVS